MEFAEYYRILRRRIWLVVLTAGLAAAAVLATRLLPHETVYPADGRVLLNDIAVRDVFLRGNDLAIGRPEEDGPFWNTFAQFVSSRHVLEAAASDLGLVLAEAEDELEPATAERIGESDVALISVAATGVPEGVTADANTPREVAVSYCDALMEKLDELWRENRVVRIASIRAILEERLPEVSEEVDTLRAEVDEIAKPYGGVPPPTLEARLTEELATIDGQVSASEVSQGAAQSRADILEQTARRAPGAPAAPAAPAEASPEAAALQQAIAQKQVQLEEELTRRTAEHEEVKAIERQIEGLRRRLAQVRTQPGGGGGATAGSIALTEAAVQAEVEAAAMARRLDLLAERATEIRSRLPEITQDARRYQEVNLRLTQAQQAYEAVLDHLERLDYEEQQLNSATLIEVLSWAEARRVPTGLMGFILKLIVAVIAGALLGVLLVFALYYVDFSFQDAHEAEMLLDVPVLAGIPRTDVEARETPVPAHLPPAEGDEDRGIL